MKIVTCENIITVLKNLGIANGDNLMVHSSLKSFGYVEGGAETVIEAITTVIGISGALIMPVFTLSFLTVKAPVLDILNTPSETGRITEVFRLKDNVGRTKHITHSVAAWGKSVLDIASLGSATAWGHESPFQWLIDNNGKILMLGVDYESCTLIHKAEEDLKVPYREMINFPNAKTILPTGQIEENNSMLYYLKNGFVRDFSEINTLIHNAGITKTAMISSAKIQVSNACDIYKFTIDKIQGKPNVLLRK